MSLSSGSADFSALTGLLGASPNLNIQVLTLGDPFMKTRLEQASYTRVTDTQFTLTGDLTPHLPDGTTLRFVDSGTNHDVVLDAPVHVGGTTTVNVIPDGGFVLPADLSGLDDVILLPKVDISTTDLDELLNFEDFSFEDILAALQAFTAFLGQFEAFGFLDTDLPVLNESINDLLGYADDFLARVNEAQSNPAGNLQILEDKLNEAMGIAESSLQDLLGILGIVDPSMDDVFDLGFDAANDMLTFEFNVGTSFSEEFGFNIPGLDFGGDLLNLASSGGLFAEGAVMLTLALGIDLATFDISDPGASLFILDETGFDATLSVGGDDIAINAGVGPFALAIASLPTQNSFVQLDGTASAGLDSSVFTGGRVSFNSIFDNLSLANFDGTLGGTISGALPVFFPNDSIHLGTITVGEEVGADLGLLENIDSLFFKTEAGQVPTPNVDLVVDVHEIVEGITGFDLSNFDLFSNIFLAIDGLDTVLGFVQDLIGGQIGNFTLPLIGDDLAKGAGFI
ncbi:MAG: hypothetical protein GWN88_23345, partial [Nitrospinaceae bacterium]|nr:hypothetical protein [Nitrospinaceae bacterium]NIU46849.1 hypothetical protein [Nitrospinaceae bacterium]NIU99051.1 hypothetical protein [Nitrospinaceae bacterium]NIW61600.1 hypothetical protein [Nitrospinaceae bacterium]